ncbi:MAG: class I SAM-dependent methyltransferase [Nocardioides sp.]
MTGQQSGLPPTRWEGPTDVGRGYGRHFADLIASGADVEGEARLADVLVPRGARILDAGSGMGRIGAALRRAGHEAYGVDLDAGLIEQSRAAYPDLPVAQARLEQLDAELLGGHGMPATFDLVVCVGNVMVLLAEDSERAVLAAFRGLLAPGGRVLIGFSLVGAPPRSRVYPAPEFEADADAAGLEIESRFATFDLRPAGAEDDFAVWVLVSDH